MNHSKLAFTIEQSLTDGLQRSFQQLELDISQIIHEEFRNAFDKEYFKTLKFMQGMGIDTRELCKYSQE